MATRIDKLIMAVTSHPRYNELTPEQKDVFASKVIGPKLGRALNMDELLHLGINTGGGTEAQVTPPEVTNTLASLIPLGTPTTALRAIGQGSAAMAGGAAGEALLGQYGAIPGALIGGLAGGIGAVNPRLARLEALAGRINQAQAEATVFNEARDTAIGGMIKPEPRPYIGLPHLPTPETQVGRANKILQPDRIAPGLVLSNRKISPLSDEIIVSGPHGQVQRIPTMEERMSSIISEGRDIGPGEMAKQAGPQKTFGSTKVTAGGKKVVAEGEIIKERLIRDMEKEAAKKRGPYRTKKVIKEEKKIIKKVKDTVQQNELGSITDALAKEGDDALSRFSR